MWLITLSDSQTVDLLLVIFDSQTVDLLLIMIDSRVDMINSHYMVIGDSHILYNSVPLYPDIMSDLQHLF